MKTINKYSLLFIFLIILVPVAYKLIPINDQNIKPTPIPTIQVSPYPTLGQKTKTTGCISANGLPDKACTPGEIDTRVTQSNIKQTICVSGYTETVRPPTSYTGPLKLKLMQAYSDTDSTKNYELDHLISLELGGNPRSEANLWPEPYNAIYNAQEKDKLENYLHDQVCSGKITLQQAQLEIANDWVAEYIRIQ